MNINKFIKPCLITFIFIVTFFVPATGLATIYLDITSPGLRQIPIAIQESSGDPVAKEMIDIMKANLDYTGLFYFIDEDAYFESPAQPFDPNNWRPLGIDIVVKGAFKIDNVITATISMYDVNDAKHIIRKRYSAKKDLLRLLSHEIANDIYYRITGHNGIFSTKIAFHGRKNNKKAVYLIDWDGHRLRRIIGQKSITMPPHWSSDGKKLVFSSEKSRRWVIHVLDFGEKKVLPVYKSHSTNIAGDFTPDGKNILISSSKKGSPDIYLLNIKRKKLTPVTYSTSIEVSPSVSPDGKEIVFVSNRTGSVQLYIMDINGKTPKRLTFDGNYNTSPDWSPSGKRIAFSGFTKGKNQIFTIKPDGSELLQLTDKGNNEEPSFSPDGRFIAFTSDREGKKSIYTMRIDGEKQRKITPKSFSEAFGPSWSPR